jgi:ribonuclease HI/endonuclease/exonuclease/phosphatase family metal-dependent hydrolase
MKPNLILMNDINITNINYSKNLKKQQKNTNNYKNKKKAGNKLKNNITFSEGFLKIATHNVRGFNNETKQNIFKTFYKEKKIDIIGITETKLNRNNGKICMNNIDSYKTWWETNEENTMGSGVGIMVKSELAKHIHKVHKSKGRLIAIDMKFKGHSDIRIINVYVESNDAEKQQRKETVQTLVSWIQQGKRANKKLIVMGDLNADPEQWTKEASGTTKNKYLILEKLQSENLIDLQKMTNDVPLQYTWESNNIKRRLDQIWISQEWSHDIFNCKVIEDTDNLLETDHNILIAKLLTQNTLQRRAEAVDRRLDNKRIIFNYELMNEQLWEMYQKQLDLNIGELNINYELAKPHNNNVDLNKTWALINQALIQAANKKIPSETKKKINKSSRPKLLLNTLSLAKHIIKIVLTINKVLKGKKAEDDIDWTAIQEKMAKIKKKHDLNFDEKCLTKPSNQQEFKEIKKKLLELNKLLRAKYKVEEAIHTEQQIKDCSERRCEYIVEEQSKMIDSILEREKKVITLDRCIIKDNSGDEILITEKEEVLKAVKDHFDKLSNTAIKPTAQLEREWTEEYEPLEQVEDDYFVDIMDPITPAEWAEVLHTLPTGKAAGPSKISYEMIKNSSKKFKDILRRFYDLCLQINDLPNQWNQAIVYPIPKPGDWELNLTKIRPITLLETPRKILMKILTNRLTSKLENNYNILKNHNYAGLPGRSTQEPIHTLNALIENARETNKELWILMQDMSKAYDLVNRDNLIKALKRIKVPIAFTDFITNSLKNRRNKIITDFGYTESYKISNGIDQGEIMSPLLWVIYYDPLFARIEKLNNMNYIGYELKHNGNKVRVTDLAYMDDSTWLAKNKKELETILKVADSFNEFNGIKVNKDKSQLIVLNSTESTANTNITYGNNTTKILPLKNNVSTRFLGVWISEKDNKNFVKNQISNEIGKAYNVMKYKKLIDDQIKYIYNVVLVPRCEYKMLITILSKEEIKKLTTQIRKLLRNKIGISNTAPNVILSHKELYKLIDLYHRQSESQITNLLKRLNDEHLMGTITEIRLRQLQEAEFLHDNPMDIWSYSRINAFKNNIIAKILCIANDLGINISPIGIRNKHKFTEVKGEIKLQRILKEEFRKVKNQLKKKNIYTLDQIVSNDGKRLLEWKQITSKNSVILKGKVPNWFKRIEEEVILDNERTLKEEFRISNNKYTCRNQRILLSTKIDHRKFYWVAGLTDIQNKDIYVGILQTKKPELYTTDTIEITHYKILGDTTIVKSSSLHMSKCTGCYRGSNRNGHCIIPLKKKFSLIIKSRISDAIENNKKVKIIDQMTADLVHEIKSLIKEDNIPIEDIIIEVNTDKERTDLIENIIGYTNTGSPAVEKLMEIYKDNKQNNRMVHTFYSDGSLKITNDKANMGIGWIQVENEEEISKFNTQTIGWPSSTRAEILAILTILLVVQEQSTINIYTDSKNAIHDFEAYKQKSNYRTYIKMDNQIVWELIFRLIEMLDLNVSLHKVKGHSNDTWNDRADEEANHGRNANSMIIVKNSYSKYHYQMQYFNINIDMNPRSFLKKMNNVNTHREFTALNRNKELVEGNTDKKISFKAINEKYTKKGKNATKYRHFKDHNFKAFNVKKLMGELPTIEKLKIRRPDIYHQDLNCIRCGKEKEDTDHLWKCVAATNDMVIIGIKSRRFLNKILHGQKKKDEIVEALHKYTKLERELKLFNTEENTAAYRTWKDSSFDKTYVWDKSGSLDDLLRGWIPRNLFQTLKNFFTSAKKIERILLCWIVKLNTWFFRRIWKPRNEMMIEWEKENNITQKMKTNGKSKKKKIRIEKMKKVKEKRDSDKMDTYHEIKRICFLSKNWCKGHSYCVLLEQLSFKFYVDRLARSQGGLVRRE